VWLRCALQHPRNCRAKATTLAGSVDSGGRPMNELCAVHAEQVAERERGREREIVLEGLGR
jgi:hypothetical protein